MSATSYHVDPETLASFAEGQLDAQVRSAVIEHLDVCEECMNDVALVMANASQPSEAGRFSRRTWLLAIAAALVLALALPAIWHARQRSPIDGLIALAPRSARVVEPRLTGGFEWAGYHGPMRASGGTADAQQLRLGGAAGDLIERAEHDRSAEAQHAAGVAMVLVEKPEEAVPKLESAARVSNDAKIWSDLAAARYAAASQLGRTSNYPTALAAADTALRADPKLPEALFNRALILERLGLSNEARRAWERYLEVDPSSPWAIEAREHLTGIPVTTQSSKFDRDRPLLEEAAARGDASAVRRFVETYRDRARAYAEGEYLGRWGEAVQKKDTGAAGRWLTIARNIATALTAISGDSLTSEATQSIDNASASDRELIAEAHGAYRSGRIAYSRHDLVTAQRHLLRAAKMFEAAHDPMALAARYYSAGVRLAQGETTVARADLERIRSEADSHPTFINLGARIRWELGRIHLLDDDFSGEIPLLTAGAAMFRRSGDRSSEAFVEAMLARALESLGRADDAWLAWTRAFGALSAEGAEELLTASLDAAMRAELQAGRGDSALALSGIELAVARVCAKPLLVIDALVHQAMLESATGHPDDALRTARQAESTARGANDDPAMRARYLADVATATGAALTATDPRNAGEPLTRAIAFYKLHGLTLWLPEPLLLRARCSARMGDLTGTMRDLEEGMAIAERRQAGASDATIGTGILDAEHALFADAIQVSLDRGDNIRAFSFGERARGSSDTIADLQRRLSGSGVAVLEIVVFSGEVVTFAVTENDFRVGRSARSIETLAALANQSISEDGTVAASALYENLIRPVETVLAPAREIIIIPDTKLRSVAFAALYDANRHSYLIERFAVASAATSASLQRETERRSTLVIKAIALPSAGATDAAGLPDAALETGEIAALYRRAQSIPPVGATLATFRDAARTADVLHVAGHTESQPGGGEQALLLTGGTGTGVERVSSKSILAWTPIRGGIVVLAACETLRGPKSAATHSLSLGEAFSAAGATDVVGTLAPIGDRDARRLFAAFHRQLTNGARPADALRAVQQDAIAADQQREGRRPWRALALLTRRIPLPH
jgi:CHAT domain-containing protein/Flp pilus assembly protein TadD